MVTTELDLDALIQPDRVSGRIYTDPAIFDLEMEKIFHASWLYVAHESQVAEPGDYFTTFIGKQPVIVTRTADDGQVRIFYNRCTHRGNLVCQYEQGNAAYFRCAYHGWTFNNAGRLIGVPFREAYGDHVDFSRLGLAEAARCEVYQGFIFASLSPDVPPLQEWIGPAHRYLDEFANQGPHGIELKAGVQKVLYRGNWKFQNENDADNYHTDFTHQVGAVIRSMRAAKSGQTIGRFGQPPGSIVRALGHGHSANSRLQSVGGSDPGDLYPAAKGTALTRKLLAQLEAKVGEAQARELLRHAGGPPHTFRMFPNLVIIGVQIRVTRPVSVGLSENYYYPALLKGVPEEVNAIRLRLHEQGFGPAGFTSPDDVEVFARNQLGLQAKAPDRDWQLMARGLHREQVDEEGALWGPVKDETGMRAIYREWKRLMAK
jgi:nitrite reductase/ring-hydroxylating ferredoxin subunit